MRKLWTKEELILVFNLYLKLPFGKMYTKTPEVIEMANLLGRSASSIAIRLSNLQLAIRTIKIEELKE